MLTTQGVEKWVLQKLAFVIAHDIFRVQKLIDFDDTTALLVNPVVLSLFLVGKRILRAFELDAHWRANQIKLFANSAFQIAFVRLGHML